MAGAGLTPVHVAPGGESNALAKVASEVLTGPGSVAVYHGALVLV